ncbi:UNVERIFIED_CONTAM: hypothetical protein ABID98_000882 [Brevibacillus sp. OAP136]|uniref:hypothetical protein n=1 Tax=Brevibacillus fluminis TaxID=511487 RepID=UPI001605D208|nr:hypothetical protein [Brevibacillus fluminis]
MTEMNNRDENKELKVLGTHAAGATDLFETRKTAKPVQIDPPVDTGTVGSTK